MGQRMFAVTLLVPDYDAAIEFYVGKLGFLLLEDTFLSPTKRWVRIAPNTGETCLLIARADTPAQQAAIGAQTGDRVAFFLQTDDFVQDYTAMRAANVQFEEAPRQETYGTVAVWRDPFGNRWDLIQFAAPDSQT